MGGTSSGTDGSSIGRGITGEGSTEGSSKERFSSCCGFVFSCFLFSSFSKAFFNFVMPN